MEDIDGDGRVLYMRIPDPHGGWRKHPAEPRLMVARQPGEVGGEYYRVMPEGTLKAWDGLAIAVNRDPEGLDLNRNFPSEWRQEYQQPGAGPYPTSEPEVRALVDFVVRHRNIGAAVSFHTHSGIILRPFGTHPDEEMIPEDLWCYKKLSALGTEATGYPAVSEYHDFREHPKEMITGTEDWIYEHLGALYWVVELWAPNRAAGIASYSWVDWYREHAVEDDLKLLAWSDRECDGQAHVDWRPFHASAARRGRDRRLGPAQLLAQPAAAPARERGGAFPGLARPARAQPAAARTAAHRGARARPRHLAHPAGGGQRRLAAGLRDASARWSARRCAA